MEENARLRTMMGFLPLAEGGSEAPRRLKPYSRLGRSQRTHRKADVRRLAAGLHALAGACPNAATLRTHRRPHPSLAAARRLHCLC